MNKLEILLGLEPIYKPEDLKKAPIKWAGGKSKLLSTILPKLKGKRLFEPFMGSCVVGLNSDIKTIHFNDFNKDLVSLFESIKNNKDSFVKETTKLFSDNNEQSYYKNREAFNNEQDSFKRACLFLYLNRHGFNGLCRYNSNGEYNVPYGKYSSVHYPLKEICSTNTILNKKKTTFTNLDFLEHMSTSKKGDVVYCDPPYAPISQTSFVNYSGNGFTSQQQEDLAKMAEDLSKKNITTLISNHDTPYTREIYKNSKEIIELDVTRSISQTAEGRGKVKEIIAIF